MSGQRIIDGLEDILALVKSGEMDELVAEAKARYEAMGVEDKAVVICASRRLRQLADACQGKSRKAKH